MYIEKRSLIIIIKPYTHFNSPKKIVQQPSSTLLLETPHLPSDMIFWSRVHVRSRGKLEALYLLRFYVHSTCKMVTYGEGFRLTNVYDCLIHWSHEATLQTKNIDTLSQSPWSSHAVS